MKLERDYQARIIRKLKVVFPGCIVLKNDPTYIQGFPDLTILYKSKWAVLEIKRSLKAPFQPNQKLYLEETNEMSYSSVICPEIEEEVFHELEIALAARRKARVPIS